MAETVECVDPAPGMNVSRTESNANKPLKQPVRVDSYLLLRRKRCASLDRGSARAQSAAFATQAWRSGAHV